MENLLPILMYHAVHPVESVIAIHPDRFAWQMRWLKENKFRVISLQQCANLIRGGDPLPEKAVAITFDDGYQCLYELALPILVEYDFPATIFLVPDYCGKSNDWPGQPAEIETLPILEWSQIEDMHDQGIDFGAHTLSHPRLDRLSAKEIEAEIIGSKSAIEQRLGSPVLAFAYPYGRFDQQIREIVQQNFQVACSTQLGYVSYNSDPFALPRVEMFYLRKSSVFKQFSKPWFPKYIHLRKGIRTVGSRFKNRQWA